MCMSENAFSGLSFNWVEIAGAALGIAYVLFSVKQNILTWATGLLTSFLYLFVFFQAKFYADMALQFYYVGISIYGWVLWIRGKQIDGQRGQLPVSKTTLRELRLLLLLSLVLWVLLFLILHYLTDSPVPLGDSFTTALSIVATWMLAKKRIEHWIIWIVVDVVSIGLYVYKELYPTVILFGVYTLAAIWGYREWKKSINRTA